MLDGDEVDTFQSPPVDLFITEFHHNIITGKQSYSPEDVAAQVKMLYEKEFVADQLTVVLDTTFDLERSLDVKISAHPY